jgi:hypothetical protein
LTIVENGLEMRKLWHPKIKGVKKANHQTLEKPIPKQPKNSLYVASLLLKFKDYL